MGLEMFNDSVVRLSQPSFSGLSVSVAAAVAVHGPSHELRPAIVPNWFVKHFFTRPVALLSRLVIPDAIAPACDGLNTNARSFDKPSPFTSPATTGVYGNPDCARPVSAIEKRFRTRVYKLMLTACLEPSDPRDHSTAVGFPAVDPPKPRDCSRRSA